MTNHSNMERYNPTPPPCKFKLQTQAILAQRIKSLCEDGYTIVTASVSPTFTFYKMRHRMKPTFIVITASPIDDFMTQKTNGRVVYSGKIQP